MPSNTPNIGLYKANPLTDGADTFNFDTHLNNNWDKIDAAVGTLEESNNQATNTATANAIIKRDASGRAKVAAPSATDDIARKAEVDAAITTAASDATTKANAVQSNLTSHANNTTVHITAAERTNWNEKASTAVANLVNAGLMSPAMVSKLNGIATGAQVNRTIATQAQAEAGTDNTTDMTPLRVKQAIIKNQADFYEEGTWTPTIYVDTEIIPTMTYYARYGEYTKISKRVTLYCYVWLSSKGTAPTTNYTDIRIKGIPYPIDYTRTSTSIAVNIARASAINLPVPQTSYSASLARNNNTFDLYWMEGTGVNTVKWRDLTDLSSFGFSISYITR